MAIKIILHEWIPLENNIVSTLNINANARNSFFQLRKDLSVKCTWFCFVICDGSDGFRGEVGWADKLSKRTTFVALISTSLDSIVAPVVLEST